MPRVTLKTGFTSPDGSEETLTEYICDVPDCPEPAVKVLGSVRELGMSFAVCRFHAASVQKKPHPPGR